MGSGASLLLRRRFNSSECKTAAEQAVARIALQRKRRKELVCLLRRDVAMLLDSHQDFAARIGVEHVILAQEDVAANEIIALFCELIMVRLPIIAKQRDCPADLKEGISCLIFAAQGRSDIPELLQLRDIFEKKYGKDFVSAASGLRPESGVSRTLIEMFSYRIPSGEVKLKIMKEIAKEFQIEWDTSESELELLKPPEGRLQGPDSFVSASSIPVKPPLQTREGPQMLSVYSNSIERRSSKDKDKTTTLQYKDTVSAAQAAMVLAEKALAAAQAAAYLTKQNIKQDEQTDSMSNRHGSSPNTTKGGHEGISASAKHLAQESLLRGIHSTPNYSRELRWRARARQAETF